MFRPWEGIWDGTARTTSVAQNPDNFAAFAGISEIWPLNEDRLTSSKLKHVLYKFISLNINDRQANLRQIKSYTYQNQNVSLTNQSFHWQFIHLKSNLMRKSQLWFGFMVVDGSLAPLKFRMGLHLQNMVMLLL